MGTLHKMHNLSKRMYINCTNICANGSGFIPVRVITRRKKESWNFYYCPSNRIFDEVVVLFFSQSKAINDTEHAWAPIALVRLLGFAPSAFSMTTWAQRQKWCFMKTPPSNSSFHTFPIFFPFPSVVFHKQEAKGHFHLLISHIRRTSKRSFAYSVYLHRSESVFFIESSEELLPWCCSTYIPSASGSCRYKLLGLMFTT